jgi:hypothetical protein
MAGGRVTPNSNTIRYGTCPPVPQSMMTSVPRADRISTQAVFPP